MNSDFTSFQLVGTNKTKQNHLPFYQTAMDYNVKENGLFKVIGHIVRFNLSDFL
jgi:hypothetical protein